MKEDEKLKDKEGVVPSSHLQSLAQFLSSSDDYSALQLLRGEITVSTPFDPSQFEMAYGGFPAFQLSSRELQEKAPELISQMLKHTDDLINKGQAELALGYIQEAVRRLIGALLEKGLNLDAVYKNANRMKGIVARIANNLGANDFTLEFSMALPWPTITIGLHFNTSAALSSV